MTLPRHPPVSSPLARVHALEHALEVARRKGRVYRWVFALATLTALGAFLAGRFVPLAALQAVAVSCFGVSVAASFRVGRTRLARTRLRGRLKAARREAGIRVKPQRASLVASSRHR